MSRKIPSRKSLRTCRNGHTYYKSSSCPGCPVCESLKNPDEEFLSVVSAPARRALENAGIKNLVKLSELTTTQLLKLHGMGPSSIPKLRKILTANGLDFKGE
jgi:hypothetical protein